MARWRRRPRGPFAGGIPLLLVGLVVLVGLVAAACGGATDSSPERSADEASGPGGATASDDASAQVSEPAADRRRIRTAEMSLAVPGETDVATTADAAATVITDLGGSVDDDDRTYGDDARATLVLRIPPDDLEAAIEELRQLGDVESSAIQTEDVTGRYTDLEGRIETLRASVERLRALIDEAADVVQIAALEGELTERETQLESAIGELRVLSEQTDLATITLSIVTADATIDDEAPSPGTALSNGWQAFTTAVVWAVAVLLTLLPFLVAGAIVLVVGRALVRRRASRRPAGAAPSAPVPPSGLSTLPAPPPEPASRPAASDPPAPL